MIIDKPGFYQSKAGKCEVVEIRGARAIGWDAADRPCCWFTDTGSHFNDVVRDITGPFIEKPKPIECWAIIWAGGIWLVDNEKNAVDAYDTLPSGESRLVHLREVTEEGNTP